MTTEITMPKLSDTMTEGVFGEWKKAVGEQVAKGDIIAEIETDKATMELEAFASGVLVEQRVGAGETVVVGAVIGIIGEAEQAAKEKAPAEAEPAAPVEAKKVEPAAAPVEKKAIEPAAEPAPSPEAGPPASGEGVPPDDQQTAEFRLPEPGPEADLRDETGKMEGTPEQDADKPGPAVEKEASSEKSAPVVRRRAQELGIDLATIHGSGPGGRILLDDLKGAEATRPESAGDQQAAEGEDQKRTDDTPHRGGEVYALNRMQAAVARTVSESWRSIPHFYVTQDIHMNRAEQIRRELKMHGVRVSLTEIIIKASALALLKFPKVNSSLKDEGIISHQEINIGLMAKVTDGLLVPVVKGCQALSLPEISDKTRKLLERVRNGTITQPEISGGTFSISNLGMYDVSEFTAIILPPQVAILAVGTVRDVLKGGGAGWPSVERYMKVTLSADHRVLDGVDAAAFLKELKRILENPVQLLL